MEWVKKNIYPLLLVGIIGVIIPLNFKVNTFLSGWDTLHPEFNFSLNLERVLSGVWRQEQGLGAIAGHSHMSELPRILLLKLASVVLPLYFLRYWFFFSMFILGPLGVYFFLKKTVFKSNSQQEKTASFFGGLFYLLNLATIQYFYVPFEMFAALYGFLPWLFLFANLFLTERGKSSSKLIVFSLLTFLSTPMAYAATLWYVYFISLIIYLITIFFLHSYTFLAFKKLIVVIIATLVINSFWLLPNISFVINSSNNVSQAKINQDFSNQAFAHDAKYATLDNALLLKSFLFDWQQNINGQNVLLLNRWHEHLQNKLTQVSGWIIAGLILAGLVISILWRDKTALAFTPIFAFSFVFLIYSHPPLNQLFTFLRDNLPIFREGLRFPWTKFSIIVMFCYAFYLSYATFIIFSRIKSSKIIFTTIFVTLVSLFVIWMFPVFSGQLISQTMKVNIPNEYFQTFSWFDKQPKSERIAVFPVASFRAWEHHRWGFEGAGFIWFGLPQSILVRDFDRWSHYNENYYWEVSYAVYSKNLDLLENVLEKYQIQWLLVDENIINPSSPKALYTDELKLILKNSNKIGLAQQFGKIKIYKVKLDTPVNNFFFLAENLPTVEPTYKWNNYDKAFEDNGHYLASSVQRLASSYYPFRSLFTGRSQQDLEFSAHGGPASGWEVEDHGDYFSFKKTLSAIYENYFLEIPKINPQDLMWVDPKDLSKVKYFSPDVFFDGKIIEVKVPKVGGYFSKDINPAEVSKDCNNVTRGFLRLTLVDSTNCTSFYLPELSQDMGYLITAETKNISGRPILFWLENTNSRRADIETYLPASSVQRLASSYLIQPPMEKDGVGYALHFDNVSIGKEKSTNQLGEINVYPIPFKFLTSIVLKKQLTTDLPPTRLTELEVSHPNPSLYKIAMQPFDHAAINNPTLVLSQSYDKGWKAYGIATNNWPLVTSIKTFLPFIFGEEVKEHVLVNNWSNGWILDNSNFQLLSSNIVIIYLPQYLEYLGFVILTVFAVFVMMSYAAPKP